MAEKCSGIKEKLSSALQEEKTINFLKNVLNYNGFGLSNSTPNLNKFLKELAKNNQEIKIINNGNRKKIINDIEIYGKKILTRTNSITNNSAYNISFKSFGYEKEDKINFANVMNVVNDKLDYYHYIFLIRIEEEENDEDQIKACYHYYLFPAEIFKIEKVEKINFNKHKKKSSLSSKYWIFHSFNSFYLKYNDDLLKLYNFCPSYINC